MNFPHEMRPVLRHWHWGWIRHLWLPYQKHCSRGPLHCICCRHGMSTSWTSDWSVVLYFVLKSMAVWWHLSNAEISTLPGSELLTEKQNERENCQLICWKCDQIRQIKEVFLLTCSVKQADLWCGQRVMSLCAEHTLTTILCHMQQCQYFVHWRSAKTRFSDSKK